MPRWPVPLWYTILYAWADKQQSDGVGCVSIPPLCLFEKLTDFHLERDATMIYNAAEFIVGEQAGFEGIA